MRTQYLTAAKHLKKGKEAALEARHDIAMQEYQKALGVLRVLPPEHFRDVLLSHVYLAHYQTLALEKRNANVAVEALNSGVSYARSTRDPIARSIAEECLAQFHQATTPA